MRIFLALALMLALGPAAAEQIAFDSAGSFDRTPERTLVAGKPIALTGELQLPPGKDRVPLVVLAHGCYGITAAESGWAQVLKDWGYATFVMDSFGGRGVEEVCTSGAVSPPQRIPDAYGALRKLAKHPRIDAQRVVLMGFSHGGMLGVGASTQWARKTFAPAGQPAFRGFVLFYPWCGVEYPERSRISAPVRLHIGALDDWTPVAPCERMVKGWQDSGQDAQIAIYPGAYHAFDDPLLSVKRYEEAGNPANCGFKVPSILGPMPPPEAWAACSTRGATVGGNAEALKKAEQDVKRELAQLFK